MSLTWKSARVSMARCSVCDHDLVVRSDGHVICSRANCRYHNKPHPMGSDPSVQRKEKAA
jgi:hypothetical protein